MKLRERVASAEQQPHSDHAAADRPDRVRGGDQDAFAGRAKPRSALLAAALRGVDRGRVRERERERQHERERDHSGDRHGGSQARRRRKA